MKFSLKCVWCILPPPWLWHRYGNLQTLPSPTQKPTQVSRYWALLSHLGLSPASSFSILSSSSWEGMRSSRPGFGSFTLNLTILAVYQNWWVQPLRCLLCDVSVSVQRSVQRSSHAASSLWVLPHLYNLGKGAETLTLTYGTAVISSSLQSVLYYVMSAILGRCDHLKTVTGNTLHTVSVFPLPLPQQCWPQHFH